jgi:hypothetical protein
MSSWGTVIIGVIGAPLAQKRVVIEAGQDLA